jgi:hypothetical protein
MAQAGAKAVAEGALQPGGVPILIPTQRASALSGNARRFVKPSLMVVRPGDEFCLAGDDAAKRWCSLYIPSKKLADANADATCATSVLNTSTSHTT